MQSYTFLRLLIDCPQTKIVTSVYDAEIHNEKSIFNNKKDLHHTCNTPKYLSTPGNVLWVHFIEVRPIKLISTHNFDLETISIIMKT